MGCRVRTVAGAGTADHLVPGLAFDARRPARRRDIEAALRGVDLVVVENVCSLPMNPPVTEAVANALQGRRAVLRHHDLPWERERYAELSGGWPPDNASWRHVAISQHSAAELGRRGIDATAVYHGTPASPSAATALGDGPRWASRRANGCCCNPPGDPRKKSCGIALAQALTRSDR